MYDIGNVSACFCQVRVLDAYFQEGVLHVIG